jgi:uncharacterized membrane protein
MALRARVEYAGRQVRVTGGGHVARIGRQARKRSRPFLRLFRLNPYMPTLYGNGQRSAVCICRMAKSEAVVAIYHTHLEAEKAVKELQRRGMDMRSLSIVAKDYHTEEHVVGYYNVGDRMKRWGSTGALWGGFWGILFGSAFFAIPGVGPLLVAGPLVAWIVGALEGAAVVGGIGVLSAGLVSMGVPKNSVLEYETAIKSDKFLLIVSGNAAEVVKARELIETTNPAHLALHSKEQPISAA